MEPYIPAIWEDQIVARQGTAMGADKMNKIEQVIAGLSEEAIELRKEVIELWQEIAHLIK